MKTIKTGIMPGKLVEVTFEEGMTAREIFDLAEITVSNHDIRLDGEKINLDTVINSGSLLVGTKMIKGNTATIKVGVMPGKLTEIAYEGGETARELFELADVEISNHDIRLDGNKINIDDVISGGALLVATKMIKGNYDGECCESCTCVPTKSYIAIDLTPEQIEVLIEAPLPTEIPEENIEIKGENLVVVKVKNEEYVVDEYMFNSIYKLVDVEKDVIEVKDDEVKGFVEEIKEESKIELAEEPEFARVYPEGVNENIDLLIEEVMQQRARYVAWVEQSDAQIEVLNELKIRIK